MKSRVAVPLLWLLCSSLSVAERDHQENNHNAQDLTGRQDENLVSREVSHMEDQEREGQTYILTDPPVSYPALEARLTASERQVEDLRVTLQEQKLLLQEQRAMLERQRETIEKQNSTFNAILEKQNSAFTAILEKQMATIHDLPSKVEELEREKRERVKVAFSASLSVSDSGHVGPYGSDTTVIYRHVFTNLGNAYDPYFGVFTAPVRGVYYFRYTAFAKTVKPRRVSLFKNAHLIVTVTDAVSKEDIEESGSNAAALILEEGDEVYTRLVAGHHIYDDRNHHTTFTGFLLYTV